MSRPVSKAGQQEERAAYGVRQEDPKIVQDTNRPSSTGAAKRAKAQSENLTAGRRTQGREGGGDYPGVRPQAERKQSEFQNRNHAENAGGAIHRDGKDQDPIRVGSRGEDLSRSIVGLRVKETRRSGADRERRREIGQDRSANSGVGRQIYAGEQDPREQGSGRREIGQVGCGRPADRAPGEDGHDEGGGGESCGRTEDGAEDGWPERGG
jgi:hypothetical protein